MAGWATYDFDLHWAEFWHAWTTDDVQDVLEVVMAEWCDEHAEGTWRRGDPLWHLSDSEYWYELIMHRAQDVMDSRYPDPYASYVRTMSAQRLPYSDEDGFFDSLYIPVFDDVYEDMKPKPATLESLVLVGGRNYISRALALAAHKLFPDSTVVLGRCVGDESDETDDTEDRIYILEDRIKFDLLDHYFDTRASI